MITFILDHLIYYGRIELASNDWLAFRHYDIFVTEKWQKLERGRYKSNYENHTKHKLQLSIN